MNCVHYFKNFDSLQVFHGYITLVVLMFQLFFSNYKLFNILITIFNMYAYLYETDGTGLYERKTSFQMDF